MHALLIDPSLVEMSGHHFNYNKSIRAQLKSRGFSVSILGHKRCDELICSQLDARRCFEVDNYAFQEPIETADKVMQKVEVMSGFTLRDLQEASCPELTAEDLILIHTATVFQLPAYRHWYAGLPEPRPCIVIQFMHPPWYLGLEEDTEFCTALLKNELNSWHAQIGQRMRLAACRT